MINKSGSNNPVRVRTPGKYIVLSTFAAVSVVVAGIAVTQWLAADNPSKPETLETVKVGKHHYVALPEFLIDLSPDSRGRITYLKMSASIVVDHRQDENSLQRIADVKPHIVERTSFFLRELQPEDFQGSEAMERVKQELLRRVNLVLGTMKAEEIVINELVIQ